MAEPQAAEGKPELSGHFPVETSANPVKRISLQALSVKFLWTFALITGIFIFTNTHPIRPHDFWWHLAAGREIAATHSIPLTDQSSYTMAGQPYLSYRIYWLAEAGLYGLYRLGGPALVVFASSLIVTAAYLLVVLLCYQASRRWGVTSFCLFFAAAMGLNSWNVRPQLVSYLMGAVFLYAIYQLRWKKGKKWLAAFPLAMVVWVNCHGSFPIGFILLGIWLGETLWLSWKYRGVRDGGDKGRRWMDPALALILAGLGALANPAGIGVVSYLRSLGGNPVVQNLVPEWAPPTFGTLDGTIFLTGLLFSSAVLSLSPKRPGFFQLATFLFFAALGLQTTRGVVWFGVVMAPVLADSLSAFAWGAKAQASEASTRRRSPVVDMIFLAILFGMALASLPWYKSYLPLPSHKAGLVSAETPLAATRFLLAERPPGRLFNELSFGSYLIWAAQPDYPVFADPRLELFPPEVWRDYLAIGGAQPGWQERLEHYGVNALMLSPTTQIALIRAAEESGDWRLIYEDEAAVILRRK